MKSTLYQNHVYNTRGSTNQMLVVPQIQTTHYGEHSFKSRSINAWNLYQRNLKTDLITCDFAKFKKLIFQHHLHQPVPAMSLMMRLSNLFINSNKAFCLFRLFSLLLFHH